MVDRNSFRPTVWSSIAYEPSGMPKCVASGASASASASRCASDAGESSNEEKITPAPIKNNKPAITNGSGFFLFFMFLSLHFALHGGKANDACGLSFDKMYGNPSGLSLFVTQIKQLNYGRPNF